MAKEYRYEFDDDDTALITILREKGLHVDLIRATRRQLDMNQAEFGELLDVDERTVRRWEAGEMDPNAEHLELEMPLLLFPQP